MQTEIVKTFFKCIKSSMKRELRDKKVKKVSSLIIPFTGSFKRIFFLQLQIKVKEIMTLVGDEEKEEEKLSKFSRGGRLLERISSS
jgi:hypothetical protein